jgi:hypothetical protein
MRSQKPERGWRLRKADPRYHAREPWRGEAQEGSGLGTGLTTGREDRALCREKKP